MAGPSATARPWPQPQPPAAWDDSIESQSSPLLTGANGQDLDSSAPGPFFFWQRIGTHNVGDAREYGAENSREELLREQESADDD